MNTKKQLTGKMKQLAAFFLLIFMAAFIISPVFSTPQGSQKVVRVGWYESPFNHTDALGRRSGYAYEYQQKIAAYTGWKYEYVEGSWSELLSKLESGEIDLLSDVSYTDERAEKMLFSSLPMGMEEYYMFISPGNTEITQNDYSSVNGKTLGVAASSIQLDLYNEWAKAHNINATLIELSEGVEESIEMLNRGEIDAYITIDAYYDLSAIVPIFEIGESDFYFSVNNDRADLRDDLDVAMNKIIEEDRYYNQKLLEKYIKASGSNLYLSTEELDWISEHQPIRVGYQDNYLAFCAADKKTGKLTGALKDYLKYASDCLKNAHIEFEAVSYHTVADAIEAMQKGEIDCVFPANFSDYDAEEQELIMTSPIMNSEMYAAIRQSEQKEFAHKENVIVAVNEGNTNYADFLLDHFPGWTPAYFKDTSACLLAVSEGKADCILINNYRFNNIAKLCDKYHLVTSNTGVDMSYSFAIKCGNTTLYTILEKIINNIPDATTHAALSYYSAEDARPTFAGFIKDNIVIFMTIFAIIALIIIMLLVQSLRAQKKINEEQRLILATETDDLTGLYNRDFFFEYVNNMYEKNPEKPMDAMILNVEQFHLLNTIIGDKFGEDAIRSLGEEIRTFLQDTEGIAGRLSADHFGIYCEHQEDCDALFDRLQNMLDNLTLNASIRLRMGVMPYQEGLDPANMFESAQTACNMVSKQSKKRLNVFDETVRTREIYEQHLLNDLRRAIEDREFEIYYQPQYDIQSDTPRLSGAEALVRWNHPTFGIISPADFINLFERNGQIGILDEYVWSEAFRQAKLWQNQYGTHFPISVNISRMDVFDADLVKTLNTLLDKNGLDKGSVNLEITESAYAENSYQVIQVLEELKKSGYGIEMDDFGTGYSSLSMLSSMPIDRLKMDGSFIRNIENDEKNIKLVEFIVHIAGNLKVPVIAEGVETEYQMQLLKNFGCRFVQGYYFSPPIPANEFEEKIIKKAL
ncbi:MAG: EAL domain-containing protein [Clostridia bacterium]|nr:EAL domain-containing protein [Clostridia bacterium]